MPINKNEITKEMLAKAMQCETAEDLIAYAKTEGIELTEAEAKAILDELSECELEDGDLKHVAGGKWDGGSPMPESRY
jgi:predicted ribosomally synthesized peptide with nif11-like leader